jgi:hypothetical protein
MNALANYLAVIVLTGLVALPSLIWLMKDLAVDRRLRRSGWPAGAPQPADGTAHRQKSSSKPTVPSTAT